MSQKLTEILTRQCNKNWLSDIKVTKTFSKTSSSKELIESRQDHGDW